MTEKDQEPSSEELAARVAELETRIHEYHRTELSRWADAVLEAQNLSNEVMAMRATVSWRVTAPLRVVRTRQLRS
ncbi:hypothetical protein [Homoserinibacter sp. YIM 151385]|uniref:hypothetical protein n=1 Tax=Homoserinibacter sp. YIM 151385 TaxID=2985506 RepID=UPI0022F067AD|nr:hypothetical protein [Homoserinibacter sp. YIM 151385]WBU37775.1 hypothetical protein OF852_12775 [Homoserinibacter sp. YIM 151385]